MATVQNLTSVENLKLTPIVEYVERAASADPSELMTLGKEVAACRALLQIFHPSIDRSIKLYNEKVAENPNDPDLSKILGALVALGDQMLDANKKFAQIAKAGAEIEMIRATRLDSVQLLHILRQIPSLIAESVERALRETVREIRAEVEPALPVQTLKKIPYFGKQSEFAVATKVNEVTSSVNSRLNGVNVPHDGDKFQNDQNTGVEESVVLEMLSTVPNEATGAAETPGKKCDG